jgi:hypothetical protein
VTWDYSPPCGNYKRTTSGYAANNTLTNMSRGTIFRLDAEVKGCSDGGTWTQTVTPVGLSSYGYSSANPHSVSVTAESAGEIDVTFTYTCGCGCGRTDTKTFKLSFN